MRKLRWVASLVTVALLGYFAVASDGVEAKDRTATSPYAEQVKPLTTVECGQCHFSVFTTIKNEGGRHQIDCVRCHRQYHVYNPRKNNYEQIMPNCAWCHQSATGGPFHGEDKAVTPCLTCHTDPHKPLAIPMDAIEADCSICHAKEAKELAEHPSKHTTDVSCADCHADKHGFIPECSACHESHSPGVEMSSKDCMSCHPVHEPLQISYSKDTKSIICAGCHEDVANMLKTNVTKHSAVTCAACHPTHGEIPACTRCHPNPHPKDILDKFPKCGQCHGIAHNLN